MSELGTPDAPLRVAIIGSGPSGFYAAERLLSRPDLHVQVEMFDRLPTPFGLVRGGVAPDHQKIKSVTKVYDRIAAHPEFRFYGNVEIGRALAREDLLAYVHAVIYAVGAAADRRMGIPGEHLPGSHSATDFVGWYNGHPDYRCLSFDLSSERALVVGNGNVAMDVARILASTTAELTATDIADHALTALADSGVREIILLGRRGPAQAAFTPKELKELGELEGVDVIAGPREVGLDALSQAAVDAAPDRNRDENIKVMAHYAERSPAGKHRRVVLRFLASPVELIGTDRVEAVRIVHNQLAPAADGSLRPRATDRTEELPVGLVFRAIGYQGTPIPGLPFDDWNAVIPNRSGRIIDGEAQVPREYVVGWIKRGPQGIIGTNKPDSHETVDALLEDLASGALPAVTVGSRAVLERLVAERAEAVSYQDWLTLDAAEKQRGVDAGGRPRVKFTRVDQMLEALGR
jgi:ferredoxin--NADP+ reductase